MKTVLVILVAAAIGYLLGRADEAKCTEKWVGKLIGDLDALTKAGYQRFPVMAMVMFRLQDMLQQKPVRTIEDWLAKLNKEYGPMSARRRKKLNRRED